MTIRNKEKLELVAGVVFMVILIIMFGNALSWSADVSITWTDSVVIEETYVQSNAATTNYGRVEQGATNRVIVSLGPVFSNEKIITVRVNTFKDSTDLHGGLIIDSMVYGMSVQAVTIAAGDTFFIQASGIDTNRNWVEGNENAAEASDCEVSWDSTQQIGSGGTCATAQEWATAGLRGATDTMGIFTGKPADSVRIDNSTAVGDRFLLYVDTVVGNIWMATADDNEGVAVRFTYKSGNINTILSLYGSETSVTGRADSIPTFTLYGHTPATGQKVAIAK